LARLLETFPRSKANLAQQYVGLSVSALGTRAAAAAAAAVPAGTPAAAAAVPAGTPAVPAGTPAGVPAACPAGSVCRRPAGNRITPPPPRCDHDAFVVEGGLLAVGGWSPRHGVECKGAQMTKRGHFNNLRANGTSCPCPLPTACTYARAQFTGSLAHAAVRTSRTPRISTFPSTVRQFYFILRRTFSVSPLLCSSLLSFPSALRSFHFSLLSSPLLSSPLLSSV